jgi:hypothetical protein
LGRLLLNSKLPRGKGKCRLTDNTKIEIIKRGKLPKKAKISPDERHM